MPTYPARPCPALPTVRFPPKQEAPIEAFLANLTDSLALPPGAVTLGSLQEAAPSTADLAVAEAGGTPAGATRRLAQAQAQAAAGKAAPAGSPTYLTATVSLDPEAAAEAGEGAQFSAAWMQAALADAVAQQQAGPVQLEGGDVAR